ncbi:MAG: ankyrin repeat domain-containing protein [Candidatus Jacksonbacteria bacterium]|jgi:hypothetical protein|nr:ankyrin repeat domain-containing protein [Candidatus Jacksonbacteria bacterium]
MNAKRMLLIAGAIAAVIAAFWVIELELDRKTVPEITQGTPRDRLIRGIKENNPSVVLKALEDGAFNGTAVPRVSGSEPALLAAVMHMCDPAIIKHLIEHYAYVNQRDKVLENTALIAAISRWNLALEPDPGITEIVQLLIDAGAYVNWGNKAGETPLLLAVNNGNFPAAMLLLKSEDNPADPNQGVPPTLRWKEGDTTVRRLAERLSVERSARYEPVKTQYNDLLERMEKVAPKPTTEPTSTPRKEGAHFIFYTIK